MNLKLQLKILSFLQFCLWGSWLTTLGSYMFVTLKFDGAAIGAVYSSLGIAAVLMPTLLGIVADKWISAKWVYAICHLVGALTLYLAAQVTTPGEMFLVILLNSLAYMPTLGLINTISYYRLQSAGLDIVTDFPPIRIWGTIGFILAMWGVSFSGFELSHMQLYIGATLSVLLALFTLTLPTIPVANAQRNQSWTEMLGLNAFALFKNKRMAIFFIFSMMLGAELQITNMFGNTFLHSFDKNPLFAGSFIVEHASVLMSISQISETLFILTIPFFLSRYGIKNVMLISIVAWMLRFGLFAFGDPTPFGTVLLVLSMIVYGCAFDFFNISGSVFVEKEVRPEIRASAQGMFLMMTNGFGCILGGMVSGKVVEHFTVEGITDWQSVWLIFAGYSLVLAFAFVALFKYKHVQTTCRRPAERVMRTKVNRPCLVSAFLFLQHVAIQSLNAVRIRLAVNSLQLRREARQHIDPLLQREEIAQHGAAPDLAGHHAQHARRIRQCPLRRNAAFRFAQTHQLHVAANKLAVGILGIHHHPREAPFAEHLLLQALHIKADIEIVHLLAQFAQGVIAIAHRIFVVDGRQHIGQRRIRLNMLLELPEHRYQMRHFFGALRRRQQEQNRVEIALLRHDAVFTQIVRQNSRRNAELGIVAAIGIDARGGQQQLTRVDKYWSSA